LQTAIFFGKCTSEAVDTIIVAAQHFVAHLKRPAAVDMLEKQNIRRTLIVLIQLLGSNLSNFEPRRKSQNDEEATITLTSHEAFSVLSCQFLITPN
jgi:hypothetical protein